MFFFIFYQGMLSKWFVIHPVKCIWRPGRVYSFMGRYNLFSPIFLSIFNFLYDAGWCWLMLTDDDRRDWGWLMLIDADWCWLMLIDAEIRFNQVFFCRSVPPQLLRSFLVIFYFGHQILTNGAIQKSSAQKPFGFHILSICKIQKKASKHVGRQKSTVVC